jgi:hypothetical protein
LRFSIASAIRNDGIVLPIYFTATVIVVIPILDNDDSKDTLVRGIINTQESSLSPITLRQRDRTAQVSRSFNTKSEITRSKQAPAIKIYATHTKIERVCAT